MLAKRQNRAKRVGIEDASTKLLITPLWTIEIIVVNLNTLVAMLISTRANTTSPHFTCGANLNSTRYLKERTNT